MVRVRILGCGTSAGVPNIAFGWGACDSGNPKNNRKRASILVQSVTTNLLIDTSPDCRQQLIDANIKKIDAVLYTHTHADHCHGIDDLRWVCVAQGAAIPIYSNAESIAELQDRFGYVFTPLDDRAGGFFYKPVLEANVISAPFAVGDLQITSFIQDHGKSETLGYRIGNFAYSTDVVELDELAFKALEGVEIWVVDALQYKAHSTHAHVDKAVQWIERVKCKKAYLTHMSQFLDYETLKSELPPHIEPAYDGLEIIL